MKPPVINGVPMRVSNYAYILRGIALYQEHCEGRWVWTVHRYKNTPEEGSTAHLSTACRQIESAIARIREAAAKLGT